MGDKARRIDANTNADAATDASQDENENATGLHLSSFSSSRTGRKNNTAQGDTGIQVDSSLKRRELGIDTPATTTGSGSMDSEDDFMSDASSQDDFMDTQGSEDESLEGMSSFSFSELSILVPPR